MVQVGFPAVEPCDGVALLAGKAGETFGAEVSDPMQGAPLTMKVVVVGTFAVGWLMPRLAGFVRDHPWVDVRLQTHNNRVNLAGEGWDFAIRFGDGTWHGTDLPVEFVHRPGFGAHAETGAP